MTAVDVVVVGCGPAGVGAARKVLARGGSCVLLESRDRVGGRAHFSDELGCGMRLDHGAQWIHGFSATHPMVQYAGQLGMGLLRPAPGQRSVSVFDDGSKPSTTDAKAASKAYRRMHERVRQHARCKDMSYIDALTKEGAVSLHRAMSGLFTDGCGMTPQRAALLNQEIYCRAENYEGARLDRWSAIRADEGTCLRGGNATLDGGYGGLIQQLCNGLDVRLRHRVSGIEYPTEDAGPVRVRTVRTRDDGQEEEVEFKAQHVVVCVPVGVLRSGSIHFSPPLPSAHTDAIASMGIAVMDKIELRWKNRWWPESVRGIDVASCASTPTWHPWPWFHEPLEARGLPILVCFVTGAFAEEVESMTDEAVAEKCTAALQSAMRCPVPSPEAVYVTRWLRDPHSQGSWSYFSVGSGVRTATQLGRSVGFQGCVSFAGEHTCDGSTAGMDIGTVHGAFLSGERAAESAVLSGAVVSPSPKRVRHVDAASPAPEAEGAE
eukprot:TRINITY_DN4809_c0_g1_i2.p1 TRINITY_DN4809_c0_g1~~TRINITY_DN4809_c0_g1_i2.p1  ORF type:complete len:491 (+),score=33.17 TRINITY_DN4809_c0_g1_i2:71-1543(+)